MNVRDSRVHSYPPRSNAAPSPELLVIRRNRRSVEVSLDLRRWGLSPYNLTGLASFTSTTPRSNRNGFAHCIRHGDCHRALKVPVRIRGPKPLPWIRPFRGDLATAYGVARFHL